MYLSRYFAPKMSRPVSARLAVLAFVACAVPIQTDAQTPAAPKVNPATGTPVQTPAPFRPRRPMDSPYAKAAYATMQAPLNRLTPVTDEMLRNPPPGDWLNWRRTYDGWAYSPLTQINRKNVKDLKVAWTFSMTSPDDAVNETTPIVHDGIMFLWNFGDMIQALDAKTGTLLWQFDYTLPSDYPSLPGFYRTKRSLAIGGNKLLVGTIDMHLIALDIKTGKKIWDVVTDDYKSERTYNSGPLVVKDKVLIGAGNCSPGSANRDGGKVAGYFPPGGCFITGHDLETGKELWRFNTVAHTNEPGGDTWNNLPDDKRGGSAISGDWPVRSGAEPDVLGHRLAFAMVYGDPRYVRCYGALHELHAGAQSRHR